MIVLPNSFDRYLAHLRYYISLSILKHGLTIEHMKKLQKIYTAEALFYNEKRDNINLNKLLGNLLNAISDITKNFEFSLKVTGNCAVNKNLLEILVTLLAKQTLFLKIKKVDNNLIIKFKNNIKNIKPIVFALNGLLLYEIRTNESVIIIPTKKTCRFDEVPSEYQYVFDRFSFLNVFFERII